MIDICISNLSTEQLISRFVGMAVVFLLFYAMAFFLNGGGGDAIVYPLIPLQFGFVPALVIIMEACFFTILYALIRSAIKKEKLSATTEIPFLPGGTAALIIFLVYQIVSDGIL